MSVQTVLLDFSLDAARLGDESGQKAAFVQLETVLKEFLPTLILAADIRVDGGSLKILTGKNDCTVSIRMFDRGLITINIEFYKEENPEKESILSLKKARILENQLKKYLNVNKSQAYAPLKRCLFGRYYPTSDERLLEYDIDKILFDEQSEFQRVQIVHSQSLGNMLVLDDLQNISEADLIYTETLMQRGKESYEGKEIVILGGGDGALLYELLKERPKFVWMLEIDALVMDACNRHLRAICGDVLDTRKGSNYEVIVGDCMTTVKKFIRNGRKVDYVFGDLTDIPIESSSDELWEFMTMILQTSFQILKPQGKFMTHGNGAICSESLKLYEAELSKVQPPVRFTKCQVFVPSFLEQWIFYQVAFDGAQAGGDE